MLLKIKLVFLEGICMKHQITPFALPYLVKDSLQVSANASRNVQMAQMKASAIQRPLSNCNADIRAAMYAQALQTQP